MEAYDVSRERFFGGVGQGHVKREDCRGQRVKRL